MKGENDMALITSTNASTFGLGFQTLRGRGPSPIDYKPVDRRMLSTIQQPSSPMFTAPSGFGKMGAAVNSDGGTIAAFCTSSTAASPSLYVTSGNVVQLVEAGTASTSFGAVSVSVLPNGNTALLYTQQQGATVKVYGRVVTPSLSVGSKVEIGTASSSSTTHINLFQAGSTSMVMWNKLGTYQAQPVSSSLQPSGTFIANYGTDNCFPSQLSTQAFDPISFLKESSGVATSGYYVIQGTDGIYVGKATSTGLGTQTKISPAGPKFSCPDIAKAPDGTIVATWGQHYGSTNVVLAQKLSSTLSTLGSPTTAFTSILATSDPLAAKIKGFSDGFLVVLSSYGVEFNAVHLSKSLAVTGTPQSLKGALSPSGGFCVECSGTEFGIPFLAFSDVSQSISSSPNLYRVSGSFSLPNPAPTMAPMASSMPGSPTPSPSASLTPKPSIQTLFIGSPQNPVLVGTNEDDTFMGYVGGETTMTGGGGQNTFVIIKGAGKDTVTDFNTGSNLLDLRQVHISSFESFLQALDNSSMIEKVTSPQLEALAGFNINAAGPEPTYQVKSAPQDLSLQFESRTVVLKDMYTLDPGSFVFYNPTSGGSSDNSGSSSQIGAIIGGIVGSLVVVTAGIFGFKKWNNSNRAIVHPQETPYRS